MRVFCERHYGDIKDGVKRKIKDPWYVILWKKLFTKKCIEKDLVVNAGLAEIAGLILTDVGGTAFDYIAIGTGTTAPSATDTALENETHREAATGTRQTVNVTNDTAVLTHTFTGYSGSEAITETGIFNDPSTGVMLARQVFSALNVDWDAGDSIEVTWKITIT